MVEAIKMGLLTAAGKERLALYSHAFFTSSDSAFWEQEDLMCVVVSGHEGAPHMDQNSKSCPDEINNPLGHKLG